MTAHPAARALLHNTNNGAKLISVETGRPEESALGASNQEPSAQTIKAKSTRTVGLKKVSDNVAVLGPR